MWEKELFLKPVLFEFLLHIDWDKLNILTLAGAYNTSKCLVMGIIWSTETLYGLLTLEGKSTSVGPLSRKDCRHQTRFPRTGKYKEVPSWLGHGSRQHWKTAQRVLHICLQEVLGGNLSGIKRERKKEKRNVVTWKQGKQVFRRDVITVASTLARTLAHKWDEALNCPLAPAMCRPLVTLIRAV